LRRHEAFRAKKTGGSRQACWPIAERNTKAGIKRVETEERGHPPHSRDGTVNACSSNIYLTAEAIEQKCKNEPTKKGKRSEALLGGRTSAKKNKRERRKTAFRESILLHACRVSFEKMQASDRHENIVKSSKKIRNMDDLEADSSKRDA